MRDSLTALAAIVILILVAALAIPPFVDWEERRLDLEAALSRAAGIPVETRGTIDLRLLPSPRMRVDGLTIGIPDGASPSLVAQNVAAEMELTALLRGQVRFSNIGIARADLRLPMEEGALRFPERMREGPEALGALAFDDLAITALSVTTITPEFGAMRRAEIADLRLDAPSLAGPWRIEGVYGGDIFRLGTGTLSDDLSMEMRLVGGVDTPLRYDIDATLQLLPEAARYRPLLDGEMRIVALPDVLTEAEPATQDPIVLSGDFASEGPGFALSALRLELGDPSLGSQLEGSGFLRLDDPRLALELAGRRLALDTIMAGPRAGLLTSWFGEEGPRTPLPPIDLALELGSVGFAGEELLDVTLRTMLENGDLQIAQSAVTLPGEARLSFAGAVDLRAGDRIAGDARLVAADGDRLARYLGRIGLEGPWLGLVRGPDLDIAGQVAIDPEGVSVHDLAFRAGAAQIGGSVAYRAPQIGRRGRVEARIRADGIDLEDLPPLDAVPLTAGENDLVIGLVARDVRYGDEGGGRIDARLRSEGETLVVDRFDIAGLAGAEASLSGRISPDGAGLISGRLQAARAAPLLALLGRFQQDGLVGLAPPFIREGGLDLAVSIDRLPPGDELASGALRLSLEGEVAGGPFSATAATLGGRTESFRFFLATRDTRDWVDLDHPAVAGQSSNLTMEMRRSGTDRYAATASGDMAGLRFRTTRALSIDAITREIWDGEIRLSSEDLRPALGLFALGDADLDTLPGEMRVSVAREPGATQLELDGRIAGERVRGDLRVGRQTLSGELAVGALSLPALIGVLLTDTGGDSPEAGWSEAPFGRVALPFRSGRMGISAGNVALGRGQVAREAQFDLVLLPDGLAVENFAADFGEGGLAGGLSLRRAPDGPLAAVGEVEFSGLPVQALIPDAPFSAQLTGALDFGASGESLAAAIADLSGGGTLLLEDLVVTGMAPDAITVGLERALREEDPLGGRRLQGHVESALDDEIFRADTITAPVTLVGGSLRLEPLAVPDPNAAEAGWRGAAAFDLVAGSVAIRGSLRAASVPPGWSGPAPRITLGWTGPIAAMTRNVDTGPLTNGVAQFVLQRELDRIEAFEREAGERTRRLEQLRMERAREAARQEWEALLEQRASRAAEARPAAIEAAQAIARARRARIEAQRAAEEEARRAQEEAERLAAEEAARAEEEARRAREEAAREAEAEAARQAEAAAQEAERRRMQDDIRRLLERERERDSWRGLFEDDSPGSGAEPPMRLLPPGFADPASN